MKVRTCILSLCMVIVPAMAMFSHQLPAEVRSAARCRVWQPLMDRLTAWLERDEIPAAATTVRSSSQSEHGAGPIMIAPAGETSGAIGAEGGTERLESLGAMAIDCRPLDGAAGIHIASCRVAMDAAGQLHRVFQAAGPDPARATAALASQVEAWRERLALRAGGVAPATGLY